VGERVPEPLEALDARGQALWHFAGGDYAKAAGLLATIEPPTPETLFLLGLRHDANGLNQPEKARACFQQIIDGHPANPLADEARKQIEALGNNPKR
jgi:TolA-binding protein